MQDLHHEKSSKSPKYALFFSISCALMYLLPNWLDLQYFRTLDVVTTSATLFIEAGLLLLAIITEVYGYKQARIAIWYTVFFNITLLVLGSFSIIEITNLKLYNDVVVNASTLIAASIIAAFISQHCNAYLIAKIKMEGTQLTARLLIAGIVASGIDTILVNILAFHNVSFNHLLTISLSAWFVKLVILLVALPILSELCQSLKHTEKIDIYEYDTKFNPFLFDNQYQAENNETLNL